MVEELQKSEERFRTIADYTSDWAQLDWAQLHAAAWRGRQGQLLKTLQHVADPELRRQLQDLAANFDYKPFLDLLS